MEEYNNKGRPQNEPQDDARRSNRNPGKEPDVTISNHSHSDAEP